MAEIFFLYLLVKISWELCPDPPHIPYKRNTRNAEKKQTNWDVRGHNHNKAIMF